MTLIPQGDGALDRCLFTTEIRLTGDQKPRRGLSSGKESNAWQLKSKPRAEEEENVI